MPARKRVWGVSKEGGVYRSPSLQVVLAPSDDDRLDLARSLSVCAHGYQFRIVDAARKVDALLVLDVPDGVADAAVCGAACGRRGQGAYRAALAVADIDVRIRHVRQGVVDSHAADPCRSLTTGIGNHIEAHDGDRGRRAALEGFDLEVACGGRTCVHYI